MNIFADTDSWFLSVITNDSGQIEDPNLAKLAPFMDLSNYPKDHPRFDDTKKNKLGFFKDECKGATLYKFVGVRPKSYCYIAKNQNREIYANRTKGISYNYKHLATFNAYVGCLKRISQKSVYMNVLRSKNHHMFLQRTLKTAFSSFSDKRYVRTKCQHTFPFASIYAKRAFCFMCARQT